MRHLVIIYTDTTSKEAIADYMERLRQNSRREYRRQQSRRYFLKQRLAGIALLALTMLAVKMLDGDATIALITVPLGLALLFSRKKLVVNNYYFETEERAEHGKRTHRGSSRRIRI